MTPAEIVAAAVYVAGSLGTLLWCRKAVGVACWQDSVVQVAVAVLWPAVLAVCSLVALAALLRKADE